MNKAIILMENKVHLFFLVDDDHTFSKSPIMWFEDIQGKVINEIGDNYDYFRSMSTNKKEIKRTIKELYPNEKGMFKEIKNLIALMKTYESLHYVGWD